MQLLEQLSGLQAHLGLETSLGIIHLPQVLLAYELNWEPVIQPLGHQQT